MSDSHGGDCGGGNGGDPSCAIPVASAETVYAAAAPSLESSQCGGIQIVTPVRKKAAELVDNSSA
jgi:hypothetical protein